MQSFIKHSIFYETFKDRESVVFYFQIIISNIVVELLEFRFISFQSFCSA